MIGRDVACYVFPRERRRLTLCSRALKSTLLLDFPHGPVGMFCYVRVGIFGQLAKAGQKRTLSAVAHGDCRVAAQSGIFGALDGRAAKAFLEILAAHRGNLLELGIHESSSRLKFRGFCSWLFGRAVRSAAVPRANILADVAAEDVVSHPGAHVFRNRAALFNGEIRDA